MYVATEDIETQRNGAVLIFWPGTASLSVSNIPDWKVQSYVRRSFESFPVRFPAIHMCFPNTTFFNILRSAATLVMPPPRTRVKAHSGDSMKMRYELMTYGIPVSLIPTTETGRLKTKNILQWIKTRKLIDAFNVHQNNVMHSETTTPTTAFMDVLSILKEQKKLEQQRVECPGVHDVIFRSAGKSCLNNPGNIAFRGVFEKYHEQHVGAKQTEKKNMIWLLIEEVEQNDGRFLTWDKGHGYWIPMTDRKEIRSKVAISLRDYNKQRRAIETSHQQHSKSSTYAFVRQDGSNKRRKRTTVCHTASGSNSDSSGTGTGTNRGDSNSNDNSSRGANLVSALFRPRTTVPSDNNNSCDETCGFLFG